MAPTNDTMKPLTSDQLRDVAHWMTGRSTGASAMTLAAEAIGGAIANGTSPNDAGDRGRCIRFLKLCPFAWSALDRLAARHSHWAEQAALIEQEFGEPRPDRAAPPTNDTMTGELAGIINQCIANGEALTCSLDCHCDRRRAYTLAVELRGRATTQPATPAPSVRVAGPAWMEAIRKAEACGRSTHHQIISRSQLDR